jgi:hypothetical protein
MSHDAEPHAARIDVRVAELRLLAAQIAVEVGREQCAWFHWLTDRPAARPPMRGLRPSIGARRLLDKAIGRRRTR